MPEKEGEEEEEKKENMDIDENKQPNLTEEIPNKSNVNETEINAKIVNDISNSNNNQVKDDETMISNSEKMNIINTNETNQSPTPNSATPTIVTSSSIPSSITITPPTNSTNPTIVVDEKNTLSLKGKLPLQVGQQSLASPSGNSTNAMNSPSQHGQEEQSHTPTKPKQANAGRFGKRVDKWVEKQELKRVFQTIDKKGDAFIDSEELINALKILDYKFPVNANKKASKEIDDIKDMIWEVDDDGDGKVSWNEYLKMYNRCRKDKSGFEPRRLFNIVEYMLFDREANGKISLEEYLQLLTLRNGLQITPLVIRQMFSGDMEANSLLTINEFLSNKELKKKIEDMASELTDVHLSVRKPDAQANRLPNLNGQKKHSNTTQNSKSAVALPKLPLSQTNNSDSLDVGTTRSSKSKSVSPPPSSRRAQSHSSGSPNKK